MKGMAAVIVVMLLAAHAEADRSGERAMVARHANRIHKTKMIVGVGGVVLGATSVAGGAYIIHNTREGGFIDLSAIDYAFGYTFVGLGSALLGTSTLVFLGPSPMEDLEDELARTDDAHVDALLEKYEQREIRRRNVLRGVGIGLAAAGLTTIGVVAWGSPSLSDPLGRGLATGGVAATYVGALVTLATLGPTVFDKMREDEAMAVAPVIAPAHGGGVVGFAGSF
jgi:hypothetical protein